jgi:hypothetical protein
VIGPASAENVVRTATPSADTFVASSAPGTSYGTIRQFEADGSPTKVALVRFPVTGVGSGTVVRATLRLYVTDASPVGGTVQAVAGPWTEATTWSTRPGLGAVVGDVGSAVKGTWVDVDVTAAVAADGDVALAITSPSSDAAGYASRQSANPPQLVVEVGPADEPPPPPPPPTEGPTLSTVADPFEGSSAPTAYANTHRIARTAAGRELVVFGRHGLGVQLAWRDGTGAWSHVTRGGAVDGMLITSTGTGDWPASIVVGRDSAGVEHAWVAFGGDATTSNKPVYLRRISELDDAAGPVLDPTVVVSPAGNGAGLVDIALEVGAQRGAVTWSARTPTGTFEQRVAWFTDLDAAEPPVAAAAARSTGSSGYLSGTLVPTSTGLALAYRNGGNRLQVDHHRATDPIDVWTAGTAGMVVPSKAHVSAVALASGDVVATAVTNVSASVQTVQRFSSSGVPSPSELSLSGYRDGSLATDGLRTWLVALRVVDGAVVSRAWVNGSWASEDRIEVGPEGGGGYAWPNALRQVDGSLRILVQGPAGSSAQRAVLSATRPIGE